MIWIELNSRVFRNESVEVDVVLDSIGWSASFWAAHHKEFKGVSVTNLNHSWSAFFHGGIAR